MFCPRTTLPDAPASICVLASSSSGNCTALLVRGARDRLFLIDAGLSPRRTRRLLAEHGVGHLPIEGMLVTHLDHDHWNSGWNTAQRDDCIVYLHRSHLGRAAREGALFRHTEPFEGHFELGDGIGVHSAMFGHDSLGVAVFRIDVRGATLGYATDVGKPTHALVAHLKHVDVLAIESNYCPVLQESSDRPEYLKRRIMGGSGHLSNEQTLSVVRAVRPHSKVVLLHLSRQCNTPAIAVRGHENAPYQLTVSAHDASTGWIPIMPTPASTVPQIETKPLGRQGTLWSTTV